MKKTWLLFLLSQLLLFSAYTQDFSNKGKEFWIPYSYHVSMNGGGAGVTMTLYITSDLATTYQVEIYGGAVIQSGSIAAGQVVTCLVPNTNFINDEGLFTGKTVHVTALKPVVVYSYITQSAVSGATVCLPTQVLGKEYYSMNYTQVSNATNANSYFTIIAVEDNTAVEITPSGNTKNGWTAGNTYTVNLNKGQIYQVLGTHNNTAVGGLYSGADLTGSKIKSVSSASGGCKRIAVFSGAGKMKIGVCSGGANSSDNLYQQLYPAASWGKKYLTVPSYNRPTNFYRVLKSDPLTNVYLNGVLISSASFFAGMYYEFSGTIPNKIEADKPISVTQYFTTQGCSGNASPYDPDMIVLNPVEQNINKVTLVSSNLVAPQNQQHHLHLIMNNGGTGKSSFKLDGNSIAASSWVTHPTDPSYSYLYLSNVAQGYHTLTSDSGFNALAYGYANAESYGYSAGSNVKDLYQFINIQNPYSSVNFPGVCKGTPFYFSIVFPYEPLQIQWIFGAALNAMGITDVTLNSPLYDSTWFVNGKQLYRYKLPNPYTITAGGNYPIQVNAQNPTPDGCGGTQEISYDLQVFDPPTAGFYFTTNGCVNLPVQFTDTTNTGGRPIINWQWNFGDATTSGLQNPSHQYATAGSYNASLRVITDVGCLSNTTTKVVSLNAQPVANFGNSIPTCVGGVVTFSDSSTISTGTITKWTWNFGDGSPPVIATSNVAQNHIYLTTGIFNATLLVETGAGCQSTLFSKSITIHPRPLAQFELPNVCLPVGAASFTSTSTIASGSIASYLWNFGNSQTATTQTAATTYSSTGPFNVTLTVTSNNGCVDDSIRVLNTVYAQPDANFIVDSVESCFGGTLNFTDQSTAANSSVTQWYWDFGDGTTSTVQNPTKQYSTVGTYLVKLYITSAIGCISDTASMNVVVLQLPTVTYTTSNPVCETQPVQFTSTSVANAGNITQYTWSINSTVTGGNNAVISYTPTTAGSYAINLTVLTDKGCTQQTNGTLIVNPRPLAIFELPNVCLPVGAASFTSTSTIASGSIASYLWNFGNSQTATTQTAATTYSSTGPFNVTLTVTSNNGCVDDSIRVLNTVYAQPQAAFSAPAEVCFGTAANFTDNSTAPNSSVTQWLWNFGDATTSTLQNPTKNYIAPGTYIVTLTCTSAIGCPSTVATRTIVVNPLPTPIFTTSTPSCETRSITFTDASVANAGNLVKWTWDFGDASNMVLTTASPFIHTYAVAGIYNATLQVETNKGCISSVLTKPVTVNVLPVAGFVSPEICLVDPFAPFVDTSSISVGSIVSWQWNFGDPNATPANPNTSTLQNPTHRFTTIGIYTSTLIVTSNQGCTDTIAQTFTVNGSIPIANFTVQNANVLCSSQDVVITNNSTVDFGSVIKLEIYWDYLNNPTIKTVDDFPTLGKNYSHNYIEFGSPFTKTYTIRMVSYSGANCLNVISKVITVLATPTVYFNALSDVCTNTPQFQILQAGITNALPGIGIFSGQGVSPAGLFDANVAGAGTFTLRYTFTGTNGCINYKEQPIILHPTPIANAGPDKILLDGATIPLDAIAPNVTYPITYLWTPAIALDTVTKLNPMASPMDDITYTLTVTSDKGCNTSDQVFIKVLKYPLIPNIFSPNGDGIHDKWFIGYLDQYKGSTVEVFNRYGQKIFSTVGYSNPWDGTVNGKPVPVGTYYFIIDPKNGRKITAGYVDVIR